jgi:hypothetical protein
MPENPSAPAFPALYDGVSKIDGAEGAVVPQETCYGKYVWKTCMENAYEKHEWKTPEYIHRKQFRLPLVIFCSL